jgi:hypothetical protein
MNTDIIMDMPMRTRPPQEVTIVRPAAARKIVKIIASNVGIVVEAVSGSSYQTLCVDLNTFLKASKGKRNVKKDMHAWMNCKDFQQKDAFELCLSVLVYIHFHFSPCLFDIFFSCTEHIQNGWSYWYGRSQNCFCIYYCWMCRSYSPDTTKRLRACAGASSTDRLDGYRVGSRRSLASSSDSSCTTCYGLGNKPI